MLKSVSSKYILEPSANFCPGRYPRLRRMVAAPPTGGYSLNYFFSPKAAGIVEQNPQVLLHTRLYRRRERSLTLYEKEDRPLCTVSVELKPRHWSAMRYYIDNICVFSPEELPEYVEPERIKLAGRYPSPFLPFDLDKMKRESEILLANEVQSEDGSYMSRDNFNTVYASSCPFAIYQIFHFLTQYPNDLAERMAGIRQILDVGGGLGIVSFVISQLLPETQIRSVEIDQKLVDHQLNIKGRLSSELGYSFANAIFTLDNILSLKGCKIEDFDAVIGWFPIGWDISSSRLVEIFQELKKGALLILLYRGRLFPDGKCESLGFRHVPIITDYPLPAMIFERI